MRALLGVLLATSPAAAQPKPPPTPPPPALSDPWFHIEVPQQPRLNEAHVFPGFGGATVFGMLLVPGAHPDMQAWPNGMLFAPPDTGDYNVIVPGTRSLRWFPATERPLSEQFLNALGRGVGAIVTIIVPHGT
jgi:hypothetical protein